MEAKISSTHSQFLYSSSFTKSQKIWSRKSRFDVGLLYFRGSSYFSCCTTPRAVLRVLPFYRRLPYFSLSSSCSLLWLLFVLWTFVMQRIVNSRKVAGAYAPREKVYTEEIRQGREREREWRKKKVVHVLKTSRHVSYYGEWLFSLFAPSLSVVTFVGRDVGCRRLYHKIVRSWKGWSVRGWLTVVLEETSGRLRP